MYLVFWQVRLRQTEPRILLREASDKGIKLRSENHRLPQLMYAGAGSILL
jgi:hypothetical protein